MGNRSSERGPRTAWVRLRSWRRCTVSPGRTRGGSPFEHSFSPDNGHPICSRWSASSRCSSSTRSAPWHRAPTWSRGPGSGRPMSPSTSRARWRTGTSSSCWPSCARPRTWRCTAARWPSGPATAKRASGGSSGASGWRPMTGAAWTSSTGCARKGRCRPGSSPTPATSRGSRPAGPTTRTSPGSSTSWSAAARSRSPGGRAASGSGTSPSGSTPTIRSSRPPRPRRSGTADDCAPWESPG